MNSSFLTQMGLTSGESKVYLVLIKRGPLKSGPLAIAAGVSYSKVYKMLARLELKGLVSHILKDDVKIFSASEPKRLLDYLDEEGNKISSQKAELEKMLPQIEKQFHSVPSSEAVLFTGFKAVTNVFRNILDELKKGESYQIMGVRYYDDLPEMKEFFVKYHQKRALKGIKAILLSNSYTRDKLVKHSYKNSEIRYLPKEIDLDINLLLYKDKVFINTWDKEPISVLIQNKVIKENIQKIFNSVWEKAEK